MGLSFLAGRSALTGAPVAGIAVSSMVVSSVFLLEMQD